MSQEPSFTIVGLKIERRIVLGIGTMLGLLVLAYVLGPVALALAWLLQRWASSESWQARDRWASIGGFAWFLSIGTVILFVGMLVPIPLLSLALWRLFPLAWALPLRLLLMRWSIALLLVPLLSLALELVHPRTVWYPRRQLFETERAQIQAQEEERQAAAQVQAEQAVKRETRRAARQRARSTQKRQTPTTREQAVQQQPEPPEPPEPPPPVEPVASDLQQGSLWATEQETSSSRTEPPMPEQSIPPEPSVPEQPSAPIQSLTVPLQDTPASPTTSYDWSKGEGSLKDL